MPLMPKANEPSALPAEKGTRSVTKYSPTGVGDAGAPVAPRARTSTLPNLRTVTVCAERSTSTRTRVTSRPSPWRRIHPSRRGHVYGSSTSPQRPFGETSSTQATIGRR